MYMHVRPLRRKTNLYSVDNGTRKIAEVQVQPPALPTVTPHKGHYLTEREQRDIAAFVECAMR